MLNSNQGEKFMTNNNHSDKYIIALTGGIASGKTLVAETLKHLGAHVIDTDIIARQVVEPGSYVLDIIKKEWGEDILNNDGTLNRRKLAAIIFNSDEDREKLNNIMHPEIRKRMNIDIEKSKETFIVLVIPLLFEANVPLKYDEAWVVNNPESRQKELLMSRDNISADEAQARINSQMPIDEKTKIADVIIDNTGSIEETRNKTKEEWEKTKHRAASQLSARLIKYSETKSPGGIVAVERPDLE
jgi:dephospho-CoA kinase